MAIENFLPTITRYDTDNGFVAFSTTRKSGWSKGKYGAFNINPYCGDDEDCVKANREALAMKLNLQPEKIVLAHQVHGVESRTISHEFFNLSEDSQQRVLEGADILVTNERNVCIGVSTADCIPVLLYDPVCGATAAIHAGWRGALAKVVGKGIYDLVIRYGSQPKDMKAIIGPGISKDSFEVGDEVYQMFAEADLGFDTSLICERRDKWHIDLPECCRQQLVTNGVKPENIHVDGTCTYQNSDKYFSARKLGQDSGRIYTGIVMM